MAINPFRIDALQLPAPVKTVPIDFSPISKLGDSIGQFRRQQQAAAIISGATDEQGNLDLERAGAGLYKAGLQDYAEPLFTVASRRAALAQAGAGQAETARHHRATEEAMRTAKVPFGWEPTPEGGYRPTPGGPADPEYLRKKAEMTGEAKGEKPPSGYRYRTDQPGVLEAIPGGPGEKVEAEAAARIGLAKTFLTGLDDTADAQGNVKPGLRQRIRSGELTGGVFNPAMAWAGLGSQGEVRRKLDSGADALLRFLTGAGMSVSEANDYVRRYRFDLRDTVGVSLSKVDQLESELKAVIGEVHRGRGGAGAPAARPAPAPGGGGGVRKYNPATGRIE